MPPLKTIIPAAGFGTRMLPAAKAVPKEMLPILGKPVIQYVVEEAAGAGSADVLLITSRDKRAIEDHFDLSPDLEARLAATGKLHLLGNLPQLREQLRIHSVRQANPLGLGHAVLQARDHVGDAPCLCLLGDTVFTPSRPGAALPAAQLVAAWQRLGGDCSVIGLERVPREKVSKYGVIGGSEVSPGVYSISRMVEKPSADSAPSDLAVAARYLLQPGVFEYLAHAAPGLHGEIQLTDALNSLAQTSRVFGVVLESRRHDIGSPEGWLATNLRFARTDSSLWNLVRDVVNEP
jgi:UTP--glucose-1-phosphate uridylyltransferase